MIEDDKRMLLNRAKTTKKDGALQASLAIFSANVVFAVLTFLLKFLIARKLGPPGYSLYSSITALLFIFSAVFPSLVMVIARSLAGKDDVADAHFIGALVKRTTRKTLLYGGLFSGGFLLCGSLIMDYLRFPSWRLVLLLAIFLYGSLVLSVPRGALEGLQRFTGLAVNIASEGVIRFGLGVMLLFLGLEMSGILLAYNLSVIGVLGLIAVQFKPFRVGAGGSSGLESEAAKELRVAWKFFFPVIITHTLLELISNIDILLVRHYLSDYESGLYSVLFTGGKFLLFGASAVATVFFPKVAILWQARRSAARLFFQGIAMTLAFGGGFCLISYYYAEPVITLLFGEEYRAASPFLTTYGLIITLIAIPTVTVKLLLARKQYQFLPVLAFVTICEFLLLSMGSPSLEGFLKRLLVIALLLNLGNLGVLAHCIRASRDR